MKGIIFTLLEEIVRNDYGEDVWDDLLDASGLDGSYTSLGNYPDEQLGKLVIAAADSFGLAPDDVLAWVGRRAIPLTAVRFPSFFEIHTNTRSFLLTLNDMIHPEVRKLYPGANPPDFVFDTTDPSVLVMRYFSVRRMCAFARGMVEGAAEHFGESVSFEQEKCMLRGDNECVFNIAFTALDVKHDGKATELARAA